MPVHVVPQAMRAREALVAAFEAAHERLCLITVVLAVMRPTMAIDARLFHEPLVAFGTFVLPTRMRASHGACTANTYAKMMTGS